MGSVQLPTIQICKQRVNNSRIAWQDLTPTATSSSAKQIKDQPPHNLRSATLLRMIRPAGSLYYPWLRNNQNGSAPAATFTPFTRMRRSIHRRALDNCYWLPARWVAHLLLVPYLFISSVSRELTEWKPPSLERMPVSLTLPWKRLYKNHNLGAAGAIDCLSLGIQETRRLSAHG